jgi:hypothetical protein
MADAFMPKASSSVVLLCIRAEIMKIISGRDTGEWGVGCLTDFKERKSEHQHLCYHGNALKLSSIQSHIVSYLTKLLSIAVLDCYLECTLRC